MSLCNNKVLVYGGKGSLGSYLVDYFKSKNSWVINIDLALNETADANVVVNDKDTWIDQEIHVLKGVGDALGTEKLDAILCVAGGWAGGNSTSKDLIKNAELMYKQSVWSSTISARIASKFLKTGGLLQLTGAAAAIEGTPSMIGYGLAKAAVHQLVKSLAAEGSGLPTDSTVLAILPITLDTPMNRKWMPKADFSTWTSASFIAEQLNKWAFEGQRPASGSLLKLVTKDNNTEVVTVFN